MTHFLVSVNSVQSVLIHIDTNIHVYCYNVKILHVLKNSTENIIHFFQTLVLSSSEIRTRIHSDLFELICIKLHFHYSV